MTKRRTHWILAGIFVGTMLVTGCFSLVVRSLYPIRGNLTVSVAASPTGATAPILETNLDTQRLIDGNTLTLSGETNYKSLTLFINQKKREAVPIQNHQFSYELDLTTLDAGWHYIAVSPFSANTASSAEAGAWLHIIPGQAHVLIPKTIVTQARTINAQSRRGYRNDIIEHYRPDQPYFGFNLEHYVEGETLRFDEDGIPLVLNNKTNWSYNPTTVSQYAFSLYNAIDKDAANRERFLNIASWLAAHQEADGSFPYRYSFAYKKDLIVPENFVSGMGQGQLLSVYARAYLLTQDERYLTAGQACLAFMTRDAEQGGTKVTLADFTKQAAALQPYENEVLFDEYLVKPETYVLNGNLFALVGLYDWWKSAPEEYGAAQAKEAFEQGCNAISVLLPYYDYNGYSAYDLLPYTADYPPYFTSSYAHSCHIYLLYTLAEVTGNQTFKDYYTRFKAYRDNAFYKQTERLLPT